jgi:DNA polymerase I
MDRLQLVGNFGRFKEIWAVDFEFQNYDNGDRVQPVCMTAEDLLSGRQIRLWRGQFGPNPPFNIGDDSLFVSYSAGAEVSCFLVLGWKKPLHILDLYVEFIALRNGRGGARNPSLLSALEFFGKKGIQFGEKSDMRKLILERTSWTREEQQALLDYCYTDVIALRDLFPEMATTIKRPWQATLRGDYMWSVAVMEYNGIPFNLDFFHDFKENWDKIQNGLIVRVDQNYGVYRPNKDGSFSFNLDLFENYLVRNEIGWPILDTGELETTDAVFEERAKTYPQLLELRYLREALGKMRLFDFPVGRDGFNRSWLNPFGSKTGRNQPGSSQFIFGAASWMRHLSQAPPGYAISVLDWSNQEFAIAAYLSGDPVMIEAYESGDPYVYFGKFAGAIPANAIPSGTTPTEAAQVFFEAWDDTRRKHQISFA